MKKIVGRVGSIGNMLVVYLAMGYMEVVFGADDPFKAVGDKTSAITLSLVTHVAAAICTLAIVIAGIMLFLNKLRPEAAYRIMGGCVIIASAAEITGFFMG